MKLSFFFTGRKACCCKKEKKSHLEQNELAKMVYMCFNLSLTTIFIKITTLSIQDDFGYYSLNLLSFTLQLFTSQPEIDKVLQELVTN